QPEIPTVPSAPAAGPEHVGAVGVEEAPGPLLPFPGVLDADARRGLDLRARCPFGSRAEIKRRPRQVGAVLGAVDAEGLADLAGTIGELAARRVHTPPARHQLATGERLDGADQ